MDEESGIDNGKPNLAKRKFDLFRPVSVKTDGRRIQSANWCVRFQHKGKRTCRSLGTADYRLATQRAKQLVGSVRQQGWASALELPSSHGSLSIPAFLENYRQSAISRGLRPLSIAHAQSEFRRLAREIGARRLVDFTPEAIQSWIRESSLKPVTLQSVLKNAASVFSLSSLQSMGMPELLNPFAKLAKPKIDHEPFAAPPRAWIQELMQEGLKCLPPEPQLALALALGCGLRWGEIISLNWEDVQTDSLRIAAGKAKGRRARIVPIGKRVQEVLKTTRGQGPVIAGDSTEVHEALCTWLRGNGIKDSKPVHYLRKCFGSLAVADHGIFIASKLLGHASINLTVSTYAGQVDKLPAVKF
ncbi:MAG: tyrosine-type recombinase/integrase [Verrucomicrobia bacterium]|nr:tyrosine-type recombinase/integrase [Verrucomicrobiota bacterium]